MLGYILQVGLSTFVFAEEILFAGMKTYELHTKNSVSPRRYAGSTALSLLHNGGGPGTWEEKQRPKKKQKKPTSA